MYSRVDTLQGKLFRNKEMVQIRRHKGMPENVYTYKVQSQAKYKNVQEKYGSKGMENGGNY